MDQIFATCVSAGADSAPAILSSWEISARDCSAMVTIALMAICKSYRCGDFLSRMIEGNRGADHPQTN